MVTATDPTTRLAYDIEGAGTPVVFLHGLTFDRRSWRPIIDLLDGAVASVAIDLPAHGESLGEPAPLDEVAGRINSLLASLAVEWPILVGHSMSAALAFVYASTYPTSGVVAVDQGMDVRPFAELLHKLEPALRGPGFAQVWQTFEDSLGLDRLSEPVRSQVLATHRVKQDVVLGYWDEVLRTDPATFQASIDARIPGLTMPCLAVFGRPLTDGERRRFGEMPDARVEEWTGGGHCVHLADPERFAPRLRRFVDYCTPTARRRQSSAHRDATR